MDQVEVEEILKDFAYKIFMITAIVKDYWELEAQTDRLVNEYAHKFRKL